MAEALIDSLSDQQLDPHRYRDVHRETLTALIDAKASGRTEIPDRAPGAPPPDLLNALRASIEAAKQRRSTGNRSTGNGARRRPAPSTTETAGVAKKSQKKPAAKVTEKPAEPVRDVSPPKKRG